MSFEIVSKKHLYRMLLCVFVLLAAGAAFAEPSTAQNAFADKLASSGSFMRLLTLYLVGLGLALTPCVYPMIGVTLGYFSSQKGYGGRKSALLALVYVMGIALTYSIFGTLSALTGSLFGGIMQNPWVVGGISLLLVALALSMFGLYEIRPPASLSNQATARGGILGALVMGLVFGLVAGPCVAPVLIGLLSFVAKSQSPAIGFSSFFMVALGIGTPLFILALFAARLPTPGVWMTAVNRLAGFMLLAVAAYFAAPILPAAVAKFSIPVIIVAAGIWFAFVDKTIRLNTRLAGIFTAFGVLLIIAGMFMMLPVKRAGNQGESAVKWIPYSDEQLQNAADIGLPVVLDFYADWCGACQELENVTFKSPEFLDAAEGVVLLRVDYTNREDKATTDLVKKWNVVGLPTLAFIDREGKEVSDLRIEGVPPRGATELIVEHLEKLKEKSQSQ